MSVHFSYVQNNDNNDNSDDEEENTVLCQINDQILTRSELALIGKNMWLNERVLNYYYQYITTTSSTTVNEEVIYLDPTLASFIVNYIDLTDADEVNDFLPGAFPKLHSAVDDVSKNSVAKSLRLLAPVNSSFVGTKHKLNTGSHWSLLCIHLTITAASEGKVTMNTKTTHYDSIQSSPNNASAINLNKSINSLFQTFYTNAAVLDGNNSEGSTYVNKIDDDVNNLQADGWSCGWFTALRIKGFVSGEDGGGEVSVNIKNVNSEIEAFKRFVDEEARKVQRGEKGKN